MAPPKADSTALVSPSTPSARQLARRRSCRTAPGSSTSPRSASTSNMPTARRVTWSSGARGLMESAPRISQLNMWPSYRMISRSLLLRRLDRMSNDRRCGRDMAVCTSATMLPGAARFAVVRRNIWGYCCFGFLGEMSPILFSSFFVFVLVIKHTCHSLAHDLQIYVYKASRWKMSSRAANIS
jgi:hypothetical protein